MPDGRSLILVVTRNGVHKLVSRPLDVSELREIAGTDGAEAVFVSPDGNWIGFWAANELRKVPVEGGVPTTIARVNATHGPNGVVWGPHDIIVYADAGTGQIMRVPATGAEPVPVTRTPASGRQYVTPFLLADGAHVLFADVRVLDDATDARLVVQSLEQDDAREVLKDASDPRVLPSGELAFMRMGTLMTVPFDSDRALPTSAPSTALDRVMQSGLRGSPGVEHPAAGMFAVSSLGALAVVRGAVVGPVQSRLVWAGHDGAVSLAEPANGAPVGARQQTRISPDGSRAVVSVVTPLKRELWIADWARDLWTRCSDCGAFRAEWAPDGRRLLLGRGNALVVHAIDNSSADEVLVEEPGDAIAVSPGPWLADGRIVYQSAPASDPAHSEIKVFDPATRSSRVVVPSGTGTEPAVSPNGRWLAYRKSAGLGDANVGQESTIFVQALSGSGFRTDVTPSGATNPYWSADGRALYYLAAASVAPGAVLFMVDIDDSDGRLVASRPREVLRYPDSQRCTPRRCFDISTDGSKFLFRARQQPNPVTSIDLILNWPAAVANKGDNAPRGR